MGYGLIDVSRVGEAEFPLIRVLYDSVFAETPVALRPDLILRDDDRVVVVIAHLEGNPLGFGVGELDARSCVVRACGVLKEYRRQGIGGRIIAMVAGLARSQGCPTVVIESPAQCEAMTGLAASLGFAPATSEQATRTVRFVKELVTR